MTSTTTSTSRPLNQIRTATASLVDEGKVTEALDLYGSALAAVLKRNTELELLIRKLRAQGKRPSSEKMNPDQLSLLLELLEAEAGEDKPDIEHEAQADAELDKSINVADDEDAARDEPKTKQKRRRALQTEGLERKDTILDLEDHQKSWEVIGKKITERLRYTPSHFWVEVIHQPVVKSPDLSDAGSEIIASPPLPPTIVPGGMAGNDVIAMLLLRKFEEHMPIHRLHDLFLREQGIDLPVSTLCEWVAWGGMALQRLQQLLLRRVTSSFLVQTDATGLRVLDSGPDNIHRGTMHVYAGWAGQADEAYDVAFVYTPTGQADQKQGPWDVLADREGFIVADASNAFDRLFNGKVASAIEVGCNSHARRKFKDHDDDPRAAYPLQLIRRLYRIETLADARKLDFVARGKLRQEMSVPVIEKLFRYYTTLVRDGVGTDPIVRAAQYSINHWQALTRFTTDGRLPLDNNLSERLLRSNRLGERNYLFAGSDDAAARMAAVRSVLATAKLHELNLFDYLRDVIDKLAHPMSEAQVEDLLPHRWKQLHMSATPSISRNAQKRRRQRDSRRRRRKRKSRQPVV